MTNPKPAAPLPATVMALMWAALTITMAGAVALAVPAVRADFGISLGYVLYPLAAGGAAAALIVSARRYSGRERLAWVIIGLGVGGWAMGECTWQGYLIGGLEVPYPGLADIFYVAGYPLMGAGVLLLPHLRSGRYERLRLGLDALVGTVAISIIMWVAYLQNVVVFDPEYSFLENAVNAFYGAGDVILLLAVMVLALRRSEYRFDPRLLAVGASLVVTAAADIIYYAQVNAGTYADGSWLDILWFISYGSLLAAALLSTRRHPIAETTYGQARWWQLLAPYGAVFALFAMTLTRIDGSDALLNWASIMVGLLIIARQGVAIRENRELVEKQRDDLVASVSHELRTPLTAVQGYTQLLSEEWEHLQEGDRRQMIEVVEGQARHLGRIVGDLIEAARDRLQAVELTLEDGRLGDILHQAVESLPAAARSRVVVEADDDLVVHADLARLRQIVVNLLTNAVRYGKDRILLTARAHEGTAYFQVHDDGPGVQKKYEAVIWERFERGAHRFDSATPGSGIGLPIARALVEAHGGAIHQHRSEVLGGACFEFTLPLPNPAPAPEAPRLLPRQAPAAAAVGSAGRS